VKGKEAVKINEVVATSNALLCENTVGPPESDYPNVKPKW